ncbi:phosphoesterase-domain-containing protein [Tothia fuscella]|uniref:Phosphoesterase-domain-containing protein n=1 Tax=Tothia fuscella TaxID=1048955 RepID=A0A9P4P4S7_9PEZI|nr:phosphoesterase-domain-containing protein [Tothia fuscella]
MLPDSLISIILLATCTTAQNTATGTAEVAAAAATAKSSSPVSYVKGKAFDRIAIIWLENTDYDKAVGDPNLEYLAKKGITLSNYNAVTHPSEPNYIAAIGGDYFGVNHDAFATIPSNISSVVDLLEDKGISWGEYQEDMPYAGFEGGGYQNQANGRNAYVRKHNPAVMYDSVARNAERLSRTKNLTHFYKDLEANTLPQWMFITPNMTSDGHDTSVTVAGTWTRTFLDPLFDNKNFMNNTLVLITWDENHTYTQKNRVLGILVGDSIPAEKAGSTDDTLYTHYSEISTVSANWDLHTLGRYDVGANVFSVVAAKTGDQMRAWSGSPAFSDIFFNQSYAGPMNSKPSGSWPEPNTGAVINGRTVLPSIVNVWSKLSDQTPYGIGVEVADGLHPPAGFVSRHG